MKTKNPMRGLLIYSFHAASGNASLVLLASLALMVAFFVTGNAFFFNMLVLAALLMLPTMVISSMGDKDGNWERFQLTMPISRSDLLKVQYLSVIITIALSVALVLATLVAGYFLGLNIFFEEVVYGTEPGFMAMILAILPSLAMPFLVSGLFFPIGTSKLGKGREAALLNILQFLAIGIILIMPLIEDWLGASFDNIAMIFLAVSAIIFIVSYFITRNMYKKIDF